MSNLVDFAEQELNAIGMGEDSDDINKLMHDHIIHMVEEFSKEGHSGFSASYAIGILSKLLNYEPLSPLTGEDSEWITIDEGMIGRPNVQQNKRCGHVFKEDGKAYDTEGKIFYPKGQRDMTYTNFDSRTPIEFPYTPKREYVEVDDDARN